jgi:hypothetical protein
MKESEKKQFRKELIEFAKNYETRPNFADAVRKVQGLAEWYRDLDRHYMTEHSIDEMARHYEKVANLYTNEVISEGRVNISNNPNYKE